MIDFFVEETFPCGNSEQDLDLKRKKQQMFWLEKGLDRQNSINWLWTELCMNAEPLECNVNSSGLAYMQQFALSINLCFLLEQWNSNLYSITCHDVRKSKRGHPQLRWQQSLWSFSLKIRGKAQAVFFLLLGYCPLINRNHRSATQQHVSLRPAVTGAPCLTVMMVNEATQQRVRKVVSVGGLSADPHQASHTLNLSQSLKWSPFSHYMGQAAPQKEHRIPMVLDVLAFLGLSRKGGIHMRFVVCLFSLLTWSMRQH